LSACFKIKGGSDQMPIVRELLHFFVPLIGAGILGILFIYISNKIMIKYYKYSKEAAYKISLEQYMGIMLVFTVLHFLRVFLHFQFNIIQWSIIGVLIIELIKQIIKDL
jgi:hypothetical protein